MVAAFLDSWLTGDPDEDSVTMEFDRPGWREVASVAARLYLGGAGAPRRYFAWGEAVRLAVLTVTLVHAAGALDAFVRLAWTHRLFGWLPAPPANIPTAPSGGIWATTGYVVQYAWIVIFLMLVLGHYRTARIIAAAAIVPDLAALVQHQLNGGLLAPYGAWAFWVLLNLAPVLAMAAFYRDPAPAVRRSWLLALAGADRIASLGDYLHDPHLMNVSLAELLILAVAAALVAPDAVRAQTATPAPPLYPRLG